MNVSWDGILMPTLPPGPHNPEHTPNFLRVFPSQPESKPPMPLSLSLSEKGGKCLCPQEPLALRTGTLALAGRWPSAPSPPGSPAHTRGDSLSGKRCEGRNQLYVVSALELQQQQRSERLPLWALPQKFKDLVCPFANRVC